MSWSQIVAVGKGSYTTNLPPGGSTPSDSTRVPTSPTITADFVGPVTSNEWWSSFLYKRVMAGDNTHKYSGKSYPHPLSIRANPAGLEMGYTTKASPGMQWEWDWAGGAYTYEHEAQLIVGIQGLNISAGKTARYSDFDFTADLSDGTRTLRATVTHGNPFVFYTLAGGNASIRCQTAPTVWYNQGGVLGITVGNSHFGIFGPTGSEWTTGQTLTSTLTGKNYLSVAILPDGLGTDADRTAALSFFRQYAYAFITGTTVSWNYNESNSALTSTFKIQTTPKEGTNTSTIQALYRHQWLNYFGTPLAYTYSSARGTMKTIITNEFSTVMQFPGILPVLPDKGYDKATLDGYIGQESGMGISGDIYNNGKALGKAAQLALIADQIGNKGARDNLLNKIKANLEDWLTAEAGESDRVLFYNKQWNSLFGYPVAHYHDTEINDHHFHYGYLLYAAAIVAEFDPAWAAPNAWGKMVEMMISDASNWDVTDTKFPKFRNFDPYAGHSWAHGSEYYGRGNNQESSSESMNYNTGLFLWGLHTGNKTLRDLGIYMWTNEATAIQQYWFDADNVVFPALYPAPHAGQVFSNGVSYNTFFGSFANHVHGISFLPLNSGSTYMGWNPKNILANIDYMYKNKGATGTWDDVIWGTMALGDPAAADARFGNYQNYGKFDGESKAHIYHHVKNLVAMGIVNPRVWANTPSYAVFDKAQTRTYVAYNATDAAITVTFGDGETLPVPAKQMASKTGPVKILGLHRKVLIEDKIKQKIFFGPEHIRNTSGTVYNLQGKQAGGSINLSNEIYIQKK